jgi:hypothetical protein
MGFKQRMTSVGHALAVSGGVVLMYAGITVAVNAAVIPVQAGFELALNQPKNVYRATLREKRIELMLGTHGKLYCGDFKTQNGNTLSVCDGPAVLEGKLFANRYIPGMSEGEEYAITVKGSEGMGYTLVDILQ